MKIQIKQISIYTIDIEEWLEDVKPYEPEVTEKDCIEYCENHTKDAIDYYANQVNEKHEIKIIS